MGEGAVVADTAPAASGGTGEPAPQAAPAPVDAEKEAKMATIQAAMERARAQRETARPKNTDNLSPEQGKVAAEIEARRVAAHLIDAEPAATPASGKPV